MERTRELAGFMPAWRDKPQSQVVEEITSYLLETRRIPDPYHFVVEDSLLISPITNRPIVDSVEKDSFLGKLEFEALLAIQDWANSNEKGLAFWISPPFGEKYPISKLVVTELEVKDGAKKLVNRAILLDLNETECVDLTCILAERSSRDYYLWNVNEVRRNPIFWELESVDWTQLVEELIRAPQTWEMIRQGEDWEEKEKTFPVARQMVATMFDFQGETAHRMYELAAQSQVLGNAQISCPPELSGNNKLTAFEVFFTSGERTLCCTCPKCGQSVEAKISGGRIHCPACGASEKWSA